ncbi:unnamed protein product, partial [Heterosigma akashiwo]
RPTRSTGTGAPADGQGPPRARESGAGRSAEEWGAGGGFRRAPEEESRVAEKNSQAHSATIPEGSTGAVRSQLIRKPPCHLKYCLLHHGVQRRGEGGEEFFVLFLLVEKKSIIT